MTAPWPSLMSSEVRACTKALLIKEAGRLLQKWRIGSLLVDDGSRYLGIITDTGSEPEGRRQGVGSEQHHRHVMHEQGCGDH